ncbi:4Fe-4S ferredoxin [Clostridia bacterium]|nr:4Fe-4S ferredoxin [Clostridia bacterium]
MKRVYVKEDWCLGCHLCEFYCAAGCAGDGMVSAFEDGVPVSRITIEEGASGAGNVNFAVQCRHCEEPHCVKSCITGALSKNDSGEVVCDEERCVGCYTCVLSCPYGCIVTDDRTDPVTGVVSGHRIRKCDLCISRSAGASGPACVSGCPNGAIVFEEGA